MELRKISQNELKTILKKHYKWLNNDRGGEKANLSYCNLMGSNLSYSDLSYCDLRYCNLMGSNLSYSDLSNSDLRGIIGLNFSLACPSHGGFTAWKKCINDRIVQLFIPADAKRLSATTSKCRCNKAFVESITSIDGSESFCEAVSQHDIDFIYRVGETIEIRDFDENRWNECSTGIHFFVDRDEAVRY